MASEISRVAALVAEGHGDRHIARVLGLPTRHAARVLIGEAKVRALPAVIEIEPRTAQEFAERISACWRRSVEAIFEAGRWLIRAKDKLEHGQFEAMVEGNLPFGASTAQRIMAIARDPRLSNPAHGQLLPPSWRTLYELTKLSDSEFTHGIESGVIRPDMERKVLINGARALMASRADRDDDALDFYPTPPWATRALIHHALPACVGSSAELGRIWEPACGEGHISRVLREYTDWVHATDIFDYGAHQDRVLDFLIPPNPPSAWNATGDYAAMDWIITNPPFTDDLAEKFILRALDIARVGVAMFVRCQFLEGVGRYEAIFRDRPPTLLAFFAERVNLCKGRWDPDGSTATAYCWLIWVEDRPPLPPFWIPPGCREKLSRPDDRERFAAWSMEQVEAAA